MQKAYENNPNSSILIGSQGQTGVGLSTEIDLANLESMQEKTIDFKKELTNYRARTEATLPYTIQQIEDVMFIDQKKVVALEYIFYQKQDTNYCQLKKDQNEKATDTMRNPAKFHEHYLETDGYPDLTTKQNPMCAFKDPPTNLRPQKLPYLKEHSTMPGKAKNKGTGLKELLANSAVSGLNSPSKIKEKKKPLVFMKTMTKRHLSTTKTGIDLYKYGEDAVVEALISLWNITGNGQIIKMKEVSFEYNMRFKPTKGGEMLLQLSQDKKIVSLPMVNDFSAFGRATDKLNFLAWKTKNLKPVEITPELKLAIEIPVIGKLHYMNYCGKNQYILQVFKRVKDDVPLLNKAGKQKKEQSYLNYQIFNAATGQKIFEIDNKYQPNEENDIRFLNLLVNEKVAGNLKYEEGDNEKDYGTTVRRILTRKNMNMNINERWLIYFQ